jgi:hypothetical protein
VKGRRGRNKIKANYEAAVRLPFMDCQWLVAWKESRLPSAKGLKWQLQKTSQQQRDFIFIPSSDTDSGVHGIYGSRRKIRSSIVLPAVEAQNR